VLEENYIVTKKELPVIGSFFIHDQHWTVTDPKITLLGNFGKDTRSF
jgi:hypothetical protein